MSSQSLETALEAVAEAAKLARQAQKAAEQEAVESAAEAADWERRYRQERERALDLRSQLRRGALQLPRRHSSLPPHSRRNTAPPPDGAQQAQQAQHDTSFRRVPLASSGSEASMGLAALSSALAACLLLQTGAAHHRTSSGAQRAPSPDDDDATEHSTVSVADDGGSGVGTAAAAAVSVALAQSWAAVAGAGAGPRAPPVSDVTSTTVKPLGKSRFKLVAAVPRNLNRQSMQAQGTAPPAAGGQNNTPRGVSPSRGLPPPPTTSSDAASEGNGSGNGDSAASTLPSEARALSADPGLALESIDDAQALNDTQEASWRATGSHLKLHWLSAPSGVLVIYKPVPEVLDAAATAVPWLLRRGIVVYVEPKAHADIRRAAAKVLRSEDKDDGNASNREMHRSGSTGSSLFGSEEPLSEACEAAAALSEAARVARASPYVDQLLDQLLLTWPAPKACECADVVPPDVVRRLDLVLTLGGDGTVLWACSMFGSGSVPPVVAMAMGSLGFMTPFPLSRMESVLTRVTSVAHGFPLMLRHRLQCRILRAGASTADLSAFNPCTDDALVLNEVVIDRGMTSTLAVLQCYVDNNLVTTIQGDGLIVSTPTGSTAYNLAAGGSMVHPSVPCILFTPICAHTLSSRPLVFPEHVTLRVKVPADSRGAAYCSFDGRGRELLHPGDSVLIHVSQWPVPMVCNLDSSHDWFLSVREGLNWNRRVPQKGR